MKFVIVTGLSGSGKSEAMRSLEDMGFYCVDNLPPALIPKFAELCYQSNSTIDKVALGIDVRGRKFFKALHESLNVLRKDKYPNISLTLKCVDSALCPMSKVNIGDYITVSLKPYFGFKSTIRVLEIERDCKSNVYTLTMGSLVYRPAKPQVKKYRN